MPGDLAHPDEVGDAIDARDAAQALEHLALAGDAVVVGVGEGDLEGHLALHRVPHLEDARGGAAAELAEDEEITVEDAVLHGGQRLQLRRRLGLLHGGRRALLGDPLRGRRERVLQELDEGQQGAQILGARGRLERRGALEHEVEALAGAGREGFVADRGDDQAAVALEPQRELRRGRRGRLLGEEVVRERAQREEIARRGGGGAPRDLGRLVEVRRRSGEPGEEAGAIAGGIARGGEREAGELDLDAAIRRRPVNQDGLRRERAVDDVVAVAERQRVGDAPEDGELVVDGEVGLAVAAAVLLDEGLQRLAGEAAEHQRRPERTLGIELLEREDVRVLAEVEEDLGLALDATIELLHEGPVALGREVRPHAAARPDPVRLGPVVLVVVAFIDEPGEIEPAVEHREGLVDAGEAELGTTQHLAQGLERVGRAGARAQILPRSREASLAEDVPAAPAGR